MEQQEQEVVSLGMLNKIQINPEQIEQLVPICDSKPDKEIK